MSKTFNLKLPKQEKIKKPYVTISFSTENFVSMNPQEGIPQIHYDQMNVIAFSHHTARIGEEYWQEVETVPACQFPQILQTAVPGLNDKYRPYTWEARVEEKLTRNKLKRQEDWEDWKHSEYLQLDQYDVQEMFSEPTKLPTDETFNVFPMI